MKLYEYITAKARVTGIGSQGNGFPIDPSIPAFADMKYLGDKSFRTRITAEWAVHRIKRESHNKAKTYKSKSAAYLLHQFAVFRVTQKINVLGRHLRSLAAQKKVFTAPLKKCRKRLMKMFLEMVRKIVRRLRRAPTFRDFQKTRRRKSSIV